MADTSYAEARQFDLDTGAGTDNVEVSGIVFAASGGAVLAGGLLETGASAFGALGVGGATPHDSVDSGNPLKIGGYATDVPPTAVTNGDRANAWFGRRGNLLTSLLHDSTGGVDGDLQAGMYDPGGTLRSYPLGSALYGFNGTTFDRLRATTALDAAPNVDTGILAIGTGPGWDRKRNPSNLGTATNSASTMVVDGADTIMVYVGTTTTGTFAFEVTADDSNWLAISAVDTQAGAVVTGNITPTSGKTYLIAVGGWREFRLRTTATLGTTMAHKITGHSGVRNVTLTDLAGNAVSTGIQYVGDAAATSTPQGTMIMGRAHAATPSDVSADDDAVAAWLLRNGAQVVSGDTAHDGVDAGNPLKIGGHARTSPPTAVSNDDRVNAWFDQYGQLQVTAVANNGDWGADAALLNGWMLGGSSVASTSPAAVGGFGYNGSSWDRLRSSQGVTAGANTDKGILAAGIGPGFARIPAAVAATGATTATVTAKGASQVVFDVAGTFTGFAATVQVSYDGTNYVTANSLQSYIDGLGVSAAGVTIAATAAIGRVFVNTWGAQSVRLNITAVASGTATVTGTANAIGSIPGGAGSVVDTELPTAAALADATSNPTVPGVGAFGHVFNGTTWDRMRSGGVTGMVGISGDTAAAATDAGNPVKIGGKGTAGDPPTAVTEGQRVNAWFDLRGSLHTVLATSGGGSLTAQSPADATSNAIVPLAVASYGSVFNGSNWDRARSVGVGDAAAATGIPAAGLMGYNGTTWDRVRTANTGRLQVDVVTGGGGGTQYVGDAAATATPTGTMSMGLAHVAAPTDVSADNDAVALWALRNGSLNVVLRDTSGAGFGTSAPSDALGPSVALAAAAYNSGFNGTNWDRLRTTDALDAAPNVTTGILAVGAGPGYDRKTNPAGVAATSTSNAVTVVVDGAESILFHVTTIGTTPGSMIFETTADDSAWATAQEVYKVGTGWISGSFVPAVNDQYIVMTGGQRQVRYRVNAVYASGTATVKVTATDTDPYPAITGDVAHGVADSGWPLKIGGVANTTVPTAVSSGQRVNAWFGTSGQLMVGLATVTGGNGVDADSLIQILRADGGTSHPMAVGGFANNGTTWDRIRTVDALDASPNVTTGIQAVGVGPGFDGKTNPAGVAATSTSNAVTVTVDGADVIMLAVTTIGTTPGSMIIEYSNDDGTTWKTHGSVYLLGTVDTAISGSFVPAVGDVYMVRTTGMRQIRYRVNAVYASGTATVKVTRSAGVAYIKGIDVGNAPHALGVTWVNKVAQYTTTQTGAALWTPASGKRVVITSVQIQVGGTTAGTMQLWFGASGDTTYTRGTDAAIFDGEFAPSTTLKPGVVMGDGSGVVGIGAVDQILRVTDSAAINPLTVSVWGYEV